MSKIDTLFPYQVIAGFDIIKVYISDKRSDIFCTVENDDRLASLNL
jgi:hypothetical protein